ncbi:tetratricopeptide repeat protein 28 isoform X2 [Planococcus citri]
MGQFQQALQDATKARDINPKWPKAYYREGVALQCLGRHGDALAVFSSGLAVEPNSTQLLAGLVEASIKSPLRGTLEPVFRQLETMNLDKSAFVIISVVGQELLAAGQYTVAVIVLESALRIGTCSLKLRGSVFSALSSAYWALNSLDKAIGYMQQDLAVAKSLGDTAGECRAHGNLGSAYFSKGSYKEALTAHRHQLVLAMKCRDIQSAASALTSLGHVYTAIGDYPNALASHKQCVQLVKQQGDKLQEAREIGNVGAVYLAMGEFESAVDCHNQHLRLAKRLGNKVEEARAYSNLGSSYHYRRNFTQAITYHEHVLRIAQELGDRAIEARAYAGLGHAARCAGDCQQAKKWHERQLDMALSTRDRIGEGRACSNLGIVYQLLGEHDAALKLHQAHLNIARALQDRAGMGRAYGNIGNAYSAMGFYEQAIKYHKQELTISKEVKDRGSEACTHGNLAVAYQALGAHEMALLHYRAHLNIARELKDTAGEACALLNLANCLSSRNEFAEAVPFYENYLMLSQELLDVEGEAKACHFLGYAHYCLGNFREAVRYYDQDLALAKDLQDKMNMGRAYCNLGLAHLALGNLDTALECQKYFLAIAHMTKHLVGKFRALGNIGDILIKLNDTEEAIKMYQRQLTFAKQSQDRSLEATAYGSLGLANRLVRCYDKALGYHTQELTVRQEMGDVKGECRAHGNLGAVHMCLGNYTNAIKCYQEQLERAKELRDCLMQAQAFGNLGIARLNMGHFEDAIGYLEQQLATLEQISSNTILIDKGRAFGNLGDCYDALGDLEEAIKCHEQHLAVGLKLKSPRDLERAYRGLGHAHKRLGNLQQALVCFEKRLVVAHELNSAEAKASAYGELGHIHTSLGNYQQAISCLQHQLLIARELKDRVAESDAACGLGQVYQQMADYSTALRYHQADLETAEELKLAPLQGRACGNLGSVYESLGNLQEAMKYQEQHLSIAAQTNDKLAKTVAYSSLGRIHHALGNTNQAVAYLTQGLQIAEVLGRREEEARIRHRLGLALWSSGQLEAAHVHLDQAASLLEIIRRESTGSTDYKLSLFDLQTASYQALQSVLVALNRTEEAMLIAERGRTRAFVDLLLERQGYINNTISNRASSTNSAITSVDQIIDIVNKQKASVLYYSLAAGYLYSWLIVPNKGIVKFHQVALSETEREQEPGTTEENLTTSGSLLENYVQNVRDSFGVENIHNNEADLDADEVWSHHLDELGDRLNQDNDRASFLRMVNRNHLFNSSNYSLSSLFSVGSLSGSVASGSTSRHGSVRAGRVNTWQGPSCLTALYHMLISPFEEYLPVSCPKDTASVPHSKGCVGRRNLLLVLEGDLYLVPFPVLRPAPSTDGISEYLSERFSLLVVPSLSSLKINQKLQRKSTAAETGMPALVVGNPKLPQSITERWGWADIPHAEQEANMVAEMLQAKSLLGNQATKESVLRQIGEAECVHLATHVSWKLSAIVLSPPCEGVETPLRPNEEFTPELESCELPSLSEFLLTASELLVLRLSARLVVVSWSHSRDGWATADGVVGLSRALLAAGAQCVLVSLWPVPDTAAKILLKAFYSALLQGSRVSRALAEAMQTVQHTKHFAHPANWSGFLLVGADVRLSNKVALMGQGLFELLKTPDKCRDALRVTLHLVEKSLQRINRGQKNAMYTTQKSIENKVGPVSGWKELLQSVGFRFEPAANGIPSSVFFPQSDPEDRLSYCSSSLQALLGLSSVTLSALSKLITSVDSGEEIITVVRQALTQLNVKNLENECVDVPVSVKLWQVSGCHELLASLGFDLMEVGVDEVTLRTGKQANKRCIQFVLQALSALFDTQDVPKSVSIESSSSLESLVSDNEDLDNDHMTLPQPILRPMSSTSVLRSGGSGAFTSYVRKRGEPDGRTAVTDGSASINKVVPQKPNRRGLGNNGGGESDAAFTPSPPAPINNEASSRNFSHQTRIRNLYPTLTSINNDIHPVLQNMYQRRPDSSSSASSATDWEGNGHNTILRRGPTTLPPTPMTRKPPPPPVQEPSDKDFETVSSALERLSVRANVSSMRTPADSGTIALFPDTKTDTSRILYFAPEVPEPDSLVDKDSLEPTSITTSTAGSEIQDQIRATQLRRLNREMTPTISEVYHERNIGLGLAPSLSKLLLPVAEEKDAKTETISKDWLSPAILQQFGTENGTSPYTDLSRRDEGDGRSIADSQCSTGSYSKKDIIQTSSPSNPQDPPAKPPPLPPVPRARTSHKNYPPPPIPLAKISNPQIPAEINE